MEQLAEAGTEFAIDAGAADLEQKIGAAAGPSHLLGFVHAAVDQEVGGAFGERGADAQTGTMAFGIVVAARNDAQSNVQSRAVSDARSLRGCEFLPIAVWAGI